MATNNDPAEVYGINTSLDGYVIESESETETPLVETVPNQKNQVADEIQYDVRHDLRLTVRGATKPEATVLTYNDQKWAVDSVEKAGTYNGLRRFNITAHRTSLYPGANTTARTQA
jgi:hypothetical protein